MNLALNAAVMVTIAPATNTVLQSPVADRTEANGTRREAVPFAVYKVPALPAAFFTPKVSAQIAGKIEKISPQNKKINAAKVIKAIGS